MRQHLNVKSVSDHVLSMLDSEYHTQWYAGNLPSIQNTHEAYGIAAERYAAVVDTMAELKRTMADALKVLPDPDESQFFPICEKLYSACVSLATDVALMAVQMQNIVHQTAPYEGQFAGTTPLETLAESGSEDDAPLADEEEDAQ